MSKILAEFFSALSAAGDVGVYAVVIILWHLERRLVRIETHLFNGKEVN